MTHFHEVSISSAERKGDSMPRKVDTKKRKPREDGLYRVGIYLGKVDGKPKYKYVYDADPKEAERKANDIRARMKKGLNVGDDQEPFAVWSERWLRLKRTDVGNSMYTTYSGYVKRLEVLEHIPISRIKPYDIQEIINELARKNPKTGKPTAKKTLSDIKHTASQIFQLAIDNRVIEYNPALAVRIPKSAPKAVRRALTDQEKGWIINTPHRMQIAAMIMLFSGLRRGELIPLEWSDVNLVDRTITVNKSVDLSSGKPVVKPTAKTDAGLRTVDIPLQLANFLINSDRKGSLVCPSLSEGLYTVDSWKSAWDSYMLDLDVLYAGPDRKNIKEKYKESKPERKSKFDPKFSGLSIEPITPHMLRHTYCTMLYLAGIDVLTAQQQMGHADAKTTLSIYTHLDQKHKRREMGKLDEYLKGN